MKDEVSTKSPKKHRIIRVLLRVLVILFVLLVSLILSLNIPGVQTYIAQKFISSIRSKTGTELSIRSVKIVFPNRVELRDIYAQDKNADTLLYLHYFVLGCSLP